MRKGLRKGLQINISNRWLYTMILMGLLIILAIGVNALTAGSKPNPGHTINETVPPAGCSSGQYLQWNGVDWVCSTISTASTHYEVILTSSTVQGNFGGDLYCRNIFGYDWKVCDPFNNFFTYSSCMQYTGSAIVPCTNGLTAWANQQYSRSPFADPQCSDPDGNNWKTNSATSLGGAITWTSGSLGYQFLPTSGSGTACSTYYRVACCRAI